MKLYWRLKKKGKWTWRPVKFSSVNWWYSKDTVQAVIFHPEEE